MNVILITVSFYLVKRSQTGCCPFDTIIYVGSSYFPTYISNPLNSEHGIKLRLSEDKSGFSNDVVEFLYLSLKLNDSLTNLLQYQNRLLIIIIRKV
ncbi:hypothetical protein TNCT_286811 [Trichonephila clavata]|uniref:Uncharacterized protein n=1 Tax=Trichonephila clavata TaxID=2740835 RepID=A0A8X6I0P2_TRICU|nr:hypothetical protein TNCT_286811 [Trichonephila clavata]